MSIGALPEGDVPSFSTGLDLERNPTLNQAFVLWAGGFAAGYDFRCRLPFAGSIQARFTGRNKWQRMKRKNVRIRRVAAQQSQASIAVFSVKQWSQHLSLIVAGGPP